VMVQALRVAGHDLTREKFIAAIESLHDADMGLGHDFVLHYGPKDHKGFDSVYATVIKDGKTVVINDWALLQSDSPSLRAMSKTQ